MHRIPLIFLGLLLGLLLAAAACSSQSPDLEPTPSTGVSQTAPVEVSAVSPPTNPTVEIPATVQPKSTPAPQAAQRTEPTQIPEQKPVGYTVGSRIPDFQLTLADGSTYSSQDLIADGKPVFLFFTASW